ncbi:MAG: hypothetical protein ACM3ZT_09585 [Bacillota bacterium]
MNSKAAIIADEIRKGFSAGDPTRPRSHTKPDFKLKRYDDSASQFGSASQCADSTGGGPVYGSGFKH